MTEPSLWAVIPAAGVGARLGAGVPKQYLKLGDRYVIEWAIEAFSMHPRIRGVVVCLAADDGFWPSVSVAGSARVVATVGGQERCLSVSNGVGEVVRHDANAWVLVHDAARPCLSRADLDRLIDAALLDPVGAILALPVRDTMKRVDADGRIRATVDRAGLWHALTPQMFRAAPLLEALGHAIEAGALITDEAHAMELSGWQPRVLSGSRDNIKITYPGDLALAEQTLRSLPREC